MASAQEVATYRATHSVAETCAYFNIKERAVYKACAKVKAPPNPAPPAPATTYPRLQRCPPRGRAALYHAQLSEIADEDTVWTCPLTGETYPDIPQPVPGTTKAMWLAERRRIVLQTKVSEPAPVILPVCQEPAPVPVPEVQQVETVSDTAPVPQEPSTVPRPVPVHLHHGAPLLIHVNRFQPSSGQNLAMWGYEWATQHGPPWSIYLAVVVFLLLVMACNL